MGHEHNALDRLGAEVKHVLETKVSRTHSAQLFVQRHR